MTSTTDTLKRRSEPAPQSDEQKVSPIRSLLLPIGVIILGLLILAYPVISTLYNNHRQIEVAEKYTYDIEHIDDSQRLADLAEAKRYNEEFPQGPLLDPWLSRVAPDNINYQNYLHILDTTDTIGRIKIPQINVDLPIFHGTEEKALSRGVGHLYGSSFPVGGLGTHAVLTGHTGLPSATLFDDLRKVKEGGVFYVEVLGQRLKYEVHDIQVVLPNETESLAPVPGEDLITLITCTPYGQNTHRLLVTGHQVPLDEEEAAEVFDKTPSIWNWWTKLMAVVLAVGIAALGYWLWTLTRKKDDEDEEDDEVSEEHTKGDVVDEPEEES